MEDKCKSPTQALKTHQTEPEVIVVEVHCKSEQEAEVLYDRLKKEGFKCRVLIL